VTESGQSGEIRLLRGGDEGDERVANPLMFFAGTMLICRNTGIALVATAADHPTCSLDEVDWICTCMSWLTLPLALKEYLPIPISFQLVTLGIYLPLLPPLFSQVTSLLLH
jgi:hypothetical protein